MELKIGEEEFIRRQIYLFPIEIGWICAILFERTKIFYTAYGIAIIFTAIVIELTFMWNLRIILERRKRYEDNYNRNKHKKKHRF